MISRKLLFKKFFLCFIIINLLGLSEVLSIWGVTTPDFPEGKWVLSDPITITGNKKIDALPGILEGSYDEWIVTETSIDAHVVKLRNRPEIIEHLADIKFSFTLPKFPSELTPGETISSPLIATGKASGYVHEGYLGATLEFVGLGIALTGKLENGVEITSNWERGPAILVDVETAEFGKKVPESDTMEITFTVPNRTFNDEISIMARLWNSEATVEWVYSWQEPDSSSSGSTQTPDPDVTDEPSFTVTPNQGFAGDELLCIGTNFPTNYPLVLSWDYYEPTDNIISVTTDSNGYFDTKFTIPDDATSGTHRIIADPYEGGRTFEADVYVKRIPIIFIPGVTGSVLDNADSIIPDELWPNQPQSSLALGKPNSVRVIASDVVRQIYYGPFWDKKGAIYDPFIKALESWGYRENVDLFLFPYDWRLDNYIHAEWLDDKIDEALSSTGQKKAVLIAHSMGGIVARAYADEYGPKKVKALITMGTPHLGSVKTYYSIIMGYDFDVTIHADENLMRYIFQTLPSGYQLLPTSPFIKEEDSGEIWNLDEAFSVSYHGVKVETDWFWNDYGVLIEDWSLNMDEDLLIEHRNFRNKIGTHAPQGFPTYTIIGQGRATLTEYVAHKPSITLPENVYDPKTYGIKKTDGSLRWLEPVFSDGDGTVSLESAEGLQGDKKYYIQDTKPNSVEHVYLQNNKRVLKLVKGLIEERASAVYPNLYRKQDVDNLVQKDKGDWFIHSSANIHIYDSSGNHLGKNKYGSFDREISGSSIIEMNGLEYCSILNMNDTYKVEVVGFEDGDFTLGMTLQTQGKTYEFIYPNVEVMNGTKARYEIPSIRSVIENTPTLLLEEDTTTSEIAPIIYVLAESTIIDHKFCTMVNYLGYPENIATEFQIDDDVFSWLNISDASPGDLVEWVFEGPNSIRLDFHYNVDWVGDNSCWATFNLGEFSKEDVIGLWSVSVFLNGGYVSSSSFEVSDPSSGIRGIPGFPLGSIIVALTGYLVSLRGRSATKKQSH